MTEQPQPQPEPQYTGHPPVRPLSPDDERTWATVTHAVCAAAMLFSAGTLGLVVAVVVYLSLRDRGPFIRAHAASAVNIQLTALIGLVVCVVLFWLIIPLFLAVAIVIAAVVVHCIAAMRAHEGQWYTPPLTIKFVS